MFNRIQVAERVKKNLNDLGVVYTTEVEINDSIQDGYNRLSIYTECIEKQATLPFVANEVYVNLYNIIPDYFRTTAIFNRGTNRWLDPLSILEFLKTRFDWEKTNGTPWNCSIRGMQYMAFYPHFATSTTLSYDIMYKAFAPELQDDFDNISIPLQYIQVLEDFVTADVLENYLEPSKAQKYWENFGVGQEKLRNKVQSRMTSWKQEGLGY